MGFWNRAGRWLASAVGLLFVIIGFNALWHGLDIIQVERGWTGVIAGTTALCAGVLVLMLTVLIDRVDGLRLAMLGQRAIQAAEAAPPMPVSPELSLDDEPEPPKPIEIPVEPPPMTAAASAPGAFSFRTFGKRPAPERPGPTVEAAPPEPVEEPLPVAPEAPAQPEHLPEQVRRFAPPQFRRPAPVPPPPEEPVAPELAPEHQPAPEPEPASMAEPAEPAATIVNVEEITQVVTVAVEASITEAIAEELRLPRASNLPPMPPVEVPAEARVADVEAPPVAPEPPAPEPGVPQRGVAQTHEWLEKALSGEEREPALDWLRQRRGGEERPERKVPSFMRRHVEAEAEAEAVAAPSDAQQAAPVVEAPPAPVVETPAVVGRYAANGSDYTLYADGSIDAQTPDGPRHFSSMDELRAFLQRQTAPTEG